MTGNGFYVILFGSVHHALRAEKLLKEGGYPCKMIPVPREISADCGVCVRISRDLASQANAALAAMSEPWRMELLG